MCIYVITSFEVTDENPGKSRHALYLHLLQSRNKTTNYSHRMSEIISFPLKKSTHF